MIPTMVRSRSASKWSTKRYAVYANAMWCAYSNGGLPIGLNVHCLGYGTPCGHQQLSKGQPPPPPTKQAFPHSHLQSSRLPSRSSILTTTPIRSPRSASTLSSFQSQQARSRTFRLVRNFTSSRGAFVHEYVCVGLMHPFLAGTPQEPCIVQP